MPDEIHITGGWQSDQQPLEPWPVPADPKPPYEIPDKLWEFAEDAITDLQLCEKDPKYKVNMSYWHEMYSDACHVCLAGAVMAKRFNVPPEDDVTPSELANSGGWHNPDRVMYSLRALDALRLGHVLDAVEVLNTSDPDFLITAAAEQDIATVDCMREEPIPTYRSDDLVGRMAFYAYMRSVIAVLKKHDL